MATHDRRDPGPAMTATAATLPILPTQSEFAAIDLQQVAHRNAGPGVISCPSVSHPKAVKASVLSASDACLDGALVNFLQALRSISETLR
jgi:hypothetical protein